MLELKNIHWKTPDGEEILKGVDLNVPEGRLTVITGPNGGGKTSLAKVIAGLYEISEGSIIYNGEDITHMSITDRSRKGIAYAFQQPVRFKGLSVRDLLELSGEEKLPEDKLCSMLSTVGLCAQEYIDREVDASLSGGESKRIEIATVLNRKGAELLVFDEPEAGIDLWSFSNLINAFEAIKKNSSRSLIIISHQERIMEIADYVAVVTDGRITTFGPKEEVLPRLLSDNRQCACPMHITTKENCHDE